MPFILGGSFDACNALLGSASFSGASFTMTEPATRNFISQWSYDRDQGRENSRDEAMQWLSADRVAEQMRQREEHHVGDDFDTLDFETRAAALEAHFFQTVERDSPSAARKSSIPAKKVTRPRPQSALLAHRIPETNATSDPSIGFAPRPRPQSAKTRSEMSCATNATQTQNEVTWKSPIQQHPSKWREMLARGPEFKQLTLRRLELETYELLYNTLQRQQVVDAKPRNRRRKRRNNENGPKNTLDHSSALACGSGLHLARSRKKRQQEHDRQMMLGKGRQSSRTSEQDKTTSAREDKQTIQDKTRRRSKLLNKKKTEKEIQEQAIPINHVSKHEKQRDEPSLPRQSNAPRTARVPWVPSGSASSLAIRGISSETSEAHLTQEKRIAQVLEVFQSHAKSHLRLSKHVQEQLKKTQQSAKIAKANDSRRIEQVIKRSPTNKNHLKRARPGSAVKQYSDRGINVGAPVSQGNQENDLANHVEFYGSTLTVPVLNTFQSASEMEPLFTASPRTPKLIVPPLKLPPNLWEYQLTNETLDGLSDTDQPSITLRYTEAHSQVSPAADSTHSPAGENPRDSLSSDEFVDSEFRASRIEDVIRPSDARPNELGSDGYSHGDQRISSARRQESVEIEEGYLTEGHTEQATIGLSTENAKPSSVEFPQESQRREIISLMPLGGYGGVTNELAGPGNGDAKGLESNSTMYTPAHLGGGDLVVSTSEGVQSTVRSSEASPTLEIAMSPTIEISVQLTAEVPRLVKKAESADTRGELTSALNVGKIVQNVESDTVNVNQQGPGGRPGSKCNAEDLVGCHEKVDSASLPATTHPGVDDFQLVSHDSSKAIREENGNSGSMMTSGIDAAMLSAPMLDGPTESQEDIEHQHRDSDPCTCVTSSEMLYDRNIADPEFTSQHEPAPSKSDLKNTDVDLRNNQAALPNASEVASARTNITTDAIAADAALHDRDSEDTLHDQRNENREIGSDHGTWSVPPTLITNDTAVNIALQPACITPMDQSSARMSDTNTKNTTAMEANETVANAVLTSEEPTQMKLTPQANVPVSPANDKAELLLQSTDTRDTTRDTGQSMQNQVCADPETNNHATTKAKSLGTKSGPRSPKRKVKKDGKSATPKKTKAAGPVHEGFSSQSTVVEVASAARLPAQISLPETHDSIGGLAEEDPLLLHQQEVTRTFLKRVSSRKVLESESASIRTCREQIERDGQLGSTESATAKVATAVMNVETQLENSVKEREDNDGDFVWPLERESSQALNDCESTVEMYSATTEEPIPIPSTGLPFESKVTDINANQKMRDLLGAAIQASGQESSDNLTSDDREVTQEQPVSTIIDKLTPQTNPDANEVVDKDFMLPRTEHHRAVRKIQAQYRCFVRRRLILDQLRFMLAKERRQARRKKAKKVKTVDTVASKNESPVATVAMAVDANSIDGAQDVQEVAPNSVSSEIGAEMSPRELSSEEAKPSKEDAMLGARKNSCEYAFDLFDGSKDTSGEMTQEVPAWEMEIGEDKVLVEAGISMHENSLAQQRDQQERLAAPPDTSADTTTSLELLHAEEMVPQQQALLQASSRIASREPLAILAAGVLPTSMMLAELAFSDDTKVPSGAVPIEADVTSEVAEVQSRWERYVDSTTSKSFYYNPATNETQWTAPAEQDYAAIISSRATPTMPHTATTDAPTSGQPKEWQEFLDEACGQMFYYNTKTGASSWEPPLGFISSAEVVALPQSDATAESAASAWVMYIDPASQAPYYVNVETLATSWERPADFAATESKTTMNAAGEDTYIIAV